MFIFLWIIIVRVQLPEAMPNDFPLSQGKSWVIAIQPAGGILSIKSGFISRRHSLSDLQREKSQSLIECGSTHSFAFLFARKSYSYRTSIFSHGESSRSSSAGTMLRTIAGNHLPLVLALSLDFRLKLDIEASFSSQKTLLCVHSFLT